MKVAHHPNLGIESGLWTNSDAPARVSHAGAHFRSQRATWAKAKASRVWPCTLERRDHKDARKIFAMGRRPVSGW